MILKMIQQFILIIQQLQKLKMKMKLVPAPKIENIKIKDIK